MNRELTSFVSVAVLLLSSCLAYADRPSLLLADEQSATELSKSEYVTDEALAYWRAILNKREWTDLSKKYVTSAKFVGFLPDGKSVLLLRDDGKTVSVSQDRLCVEDMAVIEHAKTVAPLAYQSMANSYSVLLQSERSKHQKSRDEVSRLREELNQTRSSLESELNQMRATLRKLGRLPIDAGNTTEVTAAALKAQGSVYSGKTIRLSNIKFKGISTKYARKVFAKSDTLIGFAFEDAQGEACDKGFVAIGEKSEILVKLRPGARLNIVGTVQLVRLNDPEFDPRSPPSRPGSFGGVGLNQQSSGHTIRIPHDPECGILVEELEVVSESNKGNQ